MFSTTPQTSSRTCKTIYSANWLLIWILIVYTLCGILFLIPFRYQISPDGVSYIRIAQNYLHGYFHEAINGYWSPLLSWLLLPFLLVGASPLVSAKIINIGAGEIVVIASWVLLRNFTDRRLIRTYITACIALISLDWVFVGSVVSPDLLLTACLVSYFTVIFSDRYPTKKLAIVSGAMGGTAFLAKAYALPFFIVFHTIFHMYRYYWQPSRERKVWLRAFGLSSAIFVAICVPWILVISTKYYHLTFSTSSSFNIATVGPYMHGPPMLDQGFFAPSSAHAVSSWDDPSYFKIQSWNIRLFPRPKNVHFAINLVSTNLRGLWHVLLSFWSLSVLVIMLAAVFILSPKTRNRLLLPSFLAMLVFLSGYGLTVYLDRYLWSLYILLFMFLAVILEWLWTKVSRLQLAVILVILLPTFAFLPLKNMYAARNVDKEVSTNSQALKAAHLENAKVAADAEWLKSEYLCYYLQCKFYGIPGQLNAMSAQAELAAYEVRYIFLWQPITQKPPYLNDYHLVQLGKPGAPSLLEKN